MSRPRGGRRRRRRDDRGAATVEAVWAGVLLLGPLVWLVVGRVDLQRSTFATTQAAREAGRAVVAPGGGTAAARTAVDLALADQGVDPGAATLRWVAPGVPCTSTAVTPSTTPGARYTACVRTRVDPPGVPGVLLGPGGITVEGRFEVDVDRFRAA